MSNERIDLKLNGDLARRTIGFTCANDLHTAIKMAARDYDITKSDIIRRVMCNFLYYNLDSVDGIDDDDGVELLRAINIGKRDYDRAFNTDESLDNDGIKKNIEIAKKSPVKKKINSFDLTDLSKLY